MSVVVYIVIYAKQRFLAAFIFSFNARSQQCVCVDVGRFACSRSIPYRGIRKTGTPLNHSTILLTINYTDGNCLRVSFYRNAVWASYRR